MSLKGYKITEEHRKNLSLAHKGQKPWMLGKKHTEETKEKIRQKTIIQMKKSGGYWKGKKRDRAIIEKMILARKDLIPWNKGIKTGIIPKSAFKKGHTMSEETKQKISDKLKIIKKGYKPMCSFKKGHSWTNEIKQKISQTLKRKYNTGELISPNYKDRDVGIAGLHQRLKKIKGSATKYICVDCGKQANEWSNNSHKYLLDFSDFSPRCYSCHKKFDKAYEKLLKIKN